MLRARSAADHRLALQSAVAHADVPALRNQAMQEVRASMTACVGRHRSGDNAGRTLSTVHVLRFRGAQHSLGRAERLVGQSLLVVFHKEKSGGEKFFRSWSASRRNPRATSM
jgi:hypothetical protein